MDEVTDAEAQAAKDVLARAISDYQAVVAPGEYVTGWALITHRQSIQLEQAGSTVVGLLVPTDQSFVETRGLLHIALDDVRFGGDT